jgi:pimeloyl-ACP methyl ester carboxylesterase
MFANGPISMSAALQPQFLPQYLLGPDGSRIAYHAMAGKSPGVLFCGGFASDMTGIKAQSLADWAKAENRAFVRFDYGGHGASDGEFRDGAIGAWRDDALAILDQVAIGPQVVVGSSMGGWIMLLLALARPSRVAGLVGIAPAPDFTERLIWQTLNAEARRQLTENGILFEPSDYSPEPTAITLRLIEEGRRHLLLDGAIGIDCPVRILHGMQDADVPWQLGQLLAEKLTSPDVTVTLIKAGDHRLSQPADIKRMIATVSSLLETIEAQRASA